MKTATRPQLSRLAMPLEVKAIDEGARTFSGLASTWDEDLGGDVIHKGAFARTLDHWRAAKKERPIFLLDSHNPFTIGAVLGKMIEAEETDAGLEAQFEFVPDDDAAEGAAKRVKGGYVTGLSIGYQPVKFSIEQPDGAESWERIRHLTEVKLFEVSLVVFPMNEFARTDQASVKALLEAINRAEIPPEVAAELKALPAERREQIRALLAEPKADAPTDPPPEPAQPAAVDQLSERILALKIRSLGTSALRA